MKTGRPLTHMPRFSDHLTSQSRRNALADPFAE
jgi:hypothetical protein